jgi:galactose-1-phosphate uridylyltransferase
MRRNVFVLIGLISLVGLALLGQNVLSLESPVDEHLKQLESAILEEQWGQAKAAIKDIHREWTWRKILISLNNSRRDMQEFSLTLSLLEAYIEVEDKPGAIAEATSLREIWTGFGE